MADISNLLGQLKDPSTDGKKARPLIIDIVNAMNTTGLNASSLGGYTPDYFVSLLEFKTRMEPYLKKIGMVNDLDSGLDKNETYIGLNYKYKGNVDPYSPFDSKKSEGETAGQVTHTTSFTMPKDKPTFDMSFATSNAIYTKLGYSDLSDLQSKV